MALTLSQKIVRLHTTLADARVPHAFGGALALAYCTHEPRATNDIDVNIFAEPRRARSVLASFPPGVVYDDGDLERIRREGQARLWWDASPVDVFFSSHPFHRRARRRIGVVPFAGVEIPVLDCTDLVIFKAFYGRAKDWVDITTMASAGTVDTRDAMRVIDELLGPDHPNATSLRAALSPDA